MALGSVSISTCCSVTKGCPKRRQHPHIPWVPGRCPRCPRGPGQKLEVNHEVEQSAARCSVHGACCCMSYWSKCRWSGYERGRHAECLIRGEHSHLPKVITSLHSNSKDGSQTLENAPRLKGYELQQELVSKEGWLTSLETLLERYQKDLSTVIDLNGRRRTSETLS